MKRLHHYLMESQKINEFRIKTVVELTEDQLDKLESHLRKYEAFDIETPKRTIMQSAPLDFYNRGSNEVYIIDFKTKLPVSPTVLINELVSKLGIAEGDIRVRNRAEPAEELDEIHRDKNSEGYKEPNYKPRLLDPQYKEYKNPKAEDYHGEKHKTKFLRDLEKSRKDLAKEYKIKK
jgi:hypothetical protein